METDNSGKHWPDSEFSKKVFLHSVVEADKREKELRYERHHCGEKGILHSCQQHGNSKVGVNIIDIIPLTLLIFLIN